MYHNHYRHHDLEPFFRKNVSSEFADLISYDLIHLNSFNDFIKNLNFVINQNYNVWKRIQNFHSRWLYMYVNIIVWNISLHLYIHIWTYKRHKFFTEIPEHVWTRYFIKRNCFCSMYIYYRGLPVKCTPL